VTQKVERIDPEKGPGPSFTRLLKKKEIHADAGRGREYVKPTMAVRSKRKGIGRICSREKGKKAGMMR